MSETDVLRTFLTKVQQQTNELAALTSKLRAEASAHCTVPCEGAVALSLTQFPLAAPFEHVRLPFRGLTPAAKPGESEEDNEGGDRVTEVGDLGEFTQVPKEWTDLVRSFVAKGARASASEYQEAGTALGRSLVIAGANAERAEERAKELGLEHGYAIAVSRGAAADLALLGLQLGHASFGSDEMTAEQMDLGFRRYGALESRLTEASRFANAYGDVNLLETVLQQRANIYRQTGVYDSEVFVISASLKLSRTVPKVMALMDALDRDIRSIFAKGKFDYDPTEAPEETAMKEQNERLMSRNYEYWVEWTWLRDSMDSVDEEEAYIRSHTGALFRNALYISTMLANPLLVGPDPKQKEEAVEALAEAERIAALVGDPELAAIAFAKSAHFDFTNEATDAVKKDIVDKLSAYNDAHPDLKTDEVRTTLSELREQWDKLTHCGACKSTNAKLKCGRCGAVRYCSPKCQKDHWPTHKELCQKLTKAHEKMLKRQTEV
eukprot:CAMPEP_0170749538 /NCGR_PEP_ID=MMETSP0437-20130122/10447_1 /TAXON_ID=0 /ORGANISM="Sexangularia sp." /LENGTH=492 /DNA_ID=CAMNT_0011088465 /DNA_START=1 /DNA_END=1475 /DNA_ORIENTATION=+